MDDLPENAPEGNRRSIPRTDLLLADPRIQAAERRLGRPLVKAAIARAQERARNAEIGTDLARSRTPPWPSSRRPPRRSTGVVNATGVLVHTNLGRAPLSQAARDAVAAAAGTCDVEFDLATGARAGQRGHGAIKALRAAVPSAQAAGVVNNNAAALVLAATALAAGREIIISRGELIEIGDRFRLPDLLASTGARLREVGTTNRTTVDDYEQAISADTGVHPQGPPVQLPGRGVHQEAAVGELAALGRPRSSHDIGSGLLAPHPLLPDEPDAATSLARRREPGHRQRRQAPRRTAGRPPAGRRAAGPPPAAPPAGPGPARRQADAGRPRGDHRRPAVARRPVAGRRSQPL